MYIYQIFTIQNFPLATVYMLPGFKHKLYSFDNGLATDHLRNINYMDHQRSIHIARNNTRFGGNEDENVFI